MSDNVFVDKSSGEKVRIISDDINFYELDNSVRIKKDVFYKKFEQASSEIDPNIFFSTAPSNDPLLNMANKLRSIDTNAISEIANPANINQSGTQIKYIESPMIHVDNSMSQATVKTPQMEAEIPLTKEQKAALMEEWRKNQPGAQIPIVQQKYYDDEDDIEKIVYGDKKSNVQVQPQVDPVQMMFKMFKSNYPVKLNIIIDENIPDPRFIGMFQENVEADPIEYFAKQISDKLLLEPSKIKDNIYNQLKNIINKELGIEEEKKE